MMQGCRQLFQIGGLSIIKLPLHECPNNVTFIVHVGEEPITSVWLLVDLTMRIPTHM